MPLALVERAKWTTTTPAGVNTSVVFETAGWDAHLDVSLKVGGGWCIYFVFRFYLELDRRLRK